MVESHGECLLEVSDHTLHRSESEAHVIVLLAREPRHRRESPGKDRLNEGEENC